MRGLEPSIRSKRNDMQTTNRDTKTRGHMCVTNSGGELGLAEGQVVCRHMCAKENNSGHKRYDVRSSLTTKAIQRHKSARNSGGELVPTAGRGRCAYVRSTKNHSEVVSSKSEARHAHPAVAGGQGTAG